MQNQYKIFFSDGKQDRMISEQQYEQINQFLSSRDQFIKISFDGGETEDMVQRKDIKGTKKYHSHYKDLSDNKRFTCGYGKAHILNTKCDCYVKLGCTETKMWEYIREIHPTFQGEEITKEMITHVIRRSNEVKRRTQGTETERTHEESLVLEELFRKSRYGAMMVNAWNPYIVDTEPNTKIMVDRTPGKRYNCRSCPEETPPLLAKNWDWLLGPGNHQVCIVPQQCNACRKKVKSTY